MAWVSRQKINKDIVDLNNTIPLNNTKVKEEISIKITKYFELNEKWKYNLLKFVVYSKNIALNTYVRKEERSEINTVSFHLRKLEK